MSRNPARKLRVHVLGASGSGTTTFGRALASQFSIPHHDTDDYYWFPTDPPYQDKRPIPERLALMKTMFLPRPNWVLTGSLSSWSETLLPYFDVVVFVSLDNALRLDRLRIREEHRYGKKAMIPGGERYKAHKAFLEWAALYEDPNFEGRSRVTHERWLASLKCPIVRVDSSSSPDLMVAEVLVEFQKLKLPAAI